MVVDSVVERCWLESQSVSQQSQGCEVLRACCALSLYLARFLPLHILWVSVFGWLSLPSLWVRVCVCVYMSISFAMTMTSPVELVAKTGWFDSLRRIRNKSLSSTPDKLSKTNINANGSVATTSTTTTMTGAKSLSSLYTLSVNHHSSTSSSTTKERLEISPQSTTPKTRWRFGTILNRSKKSDSSVDISNRSVDELLSASSRQNAPSSGHTVHLPMLKEQRDEDDKNLSQFCTLPRKRLQTSQNQQQQQQQQPQDCQEQNGRAASIRLLPPLSASTSRSRAYTSSTSSLDRRKKRSTVWYTISEGDMHGNKSRVSLFSLELSKKARKNKKVEEIGGSYIDGYIGELCVVVVIVYVTTDSLVRCVRAYA